MTSQSAGHTPSVDPVLNSERLAEEQTWLLTFLDFCEAHRGAVGESQEEFIPPFEPGEPFEISFTSVGGAPTTADLIRQAAMTASWVPYSETLRPVVQHYARAGVALHTWSERLHSYRRLLIAELKEAEGVTVSGLRPVLLGMELVLARITTLLWEVYPQELFQQFEQRNQQFAGVVECLTDAVFTTTLDGTITGWNARAEALYGYAAPEAVGRPASMLVPLDRLPEFQDISTRLSLEQGVENIETVRLTKTGDPIDVLVTVAPIRLPGGSVVGAFTVASDVTEQRRTEEAFHVMAESAPSGIALADESGIIRGVNTETERLFGYDREELVGRSLDMLLPERGNTHQSGQRHSQRAGQRAASQIGAREMVGVRKDGTQFQVEVTMREVVRNQKVLLIAAIVDLTLRKEAESDLLQHQKMEAIGRLAGGVAHDFNNLLTVMMGCSELLLQSLPKKESSQRKLVDEIVRAANSAEVITSQLLTFSHKSVLAPRVLDLVNVLRGMRNMLQRLVGEEIQLSVTEGPGSSDVFVDPAQIEQLILNLTVNAADAMPSGGTLTFTVRSVEAVTTGAGMPHPWEQGNYVCLTVEDTGTGIAPETLPHVFEPFFTTKKAGHGTGLGLSTVLGVVEQSGGHILVESRGGQGTRFDVYLPCGVADVQLVTRDPGNVPMTSAAGVMVLLVEDEESVLAVCEAVLRAEGYDVLTAPTGQRALDLMSVYKGPINLLVTDVVMPEMSGSQLVRMARTLRPDVQVLYMSGYTSDAVVRHGVFSAEERFLQKPFTPQTLLSSVRDALAVATTSC